MARRKRDSFHKKTRWFGKGSKSRRILLICVLSVIVITLSGIVGYYRLLSWLQGDSFRETLAGIICNRAQAEQVDVPFRLAINGNRIALPAVHITRKGSIRSIGAKRISSEVDREALLDRQLVLKKLTIEELSLLFDTAHAEEKLPRVSNERKGFWSRFTPTDTTLKAFECKDTDMGGLIGGKSCALAGVSVSAAPNPQLGKDVWQVNLENGRLRTPLYYLQDCSVKNAALLLSPERYTLSECRLQLTPGELRIKGLYERDSERWSGTVRANKANVARLLKGDWKKRLSGELFGELELTGKGGEISTGKGLMALQQGVLEGLPILSSLGWGDNRPYRTIRLEKAECRISFPYSDADRNISAAWLIDKIDIRAKGDSMLVRGHVIIGTDQSLGGTLHIGVPENLPGKWGLSNDVCAQLFTGTGESGYYWLNMNLSGTVDDPQQDLSVRLSALAGRILPGMAANAAKTVGNAILNALPGGGESPSDTPQEEQTDAPDGSDAETPADDASPVDFMKDAVEKNGKGLLKMIF